MEGFHTHIIYSNVPSRPYFSPGSVHSNCMDCLLGQASNADHLIETGKVLQNLCEWIKVWVSLGKLYTRAQVYVSP